ncbi:MAG: zinc transporter ZntB [Gammaproteobacteria bacterium]|nr:zinc transporter ZntB [Gammaproteobacteria bacterium]
MNEGWLLLACKLDGKGGADPISATEVTQPIDGKHWIHLDITQPQAQDWLRQHSGLDSLLVEALTAEETRPRVVEHGDGMLCFLRAVNLNEDADPEDMVSIRLYIDQNRIISNRRRKLKAVADLEQRLEKGSGPKTTGEVLSMLIAGLCDRMESSVIRLGELTDDVEERIIEKPDSRLRHEVVLIRKRAIMFRRYLSPQRDALAKLRNTDLKFFSSMDKRYLQESYDRLTRFVEDLDAVRERAQIVQDELTSLLSDRLNKNTYLLSVIAAVFLPLGFFTGLLGINVGGLPGVDDPSAFWEFSLLLVAMVVVQVLFFKWRKWF